MCLILIALESHPQYPLIIAANRDEYFNRPTKPAHFWDKDQSMLAGKDLEAGGTWLGITTSGRFAAVTNYRDPEHMKDRALSRGLLTADFLQSIHDPQDYIRGVSSRDDQYNGYNLLLSSDLKQIYHYSNITSQLTALSNGIHGLSNHLLNTPWPKVAKARAMLEQRIARHKIDVEGLFNILCDSTVAPDPELPHTGVGLELERVLSPICIRADGYGTRCSTVILVDRHNRMTFEERTLLNGEKTVESRKYTLEISA
jgi:uncharacterized protein with NRDE domain